MNFPDSTPEKEASPTLGSLIERIFEAPLNHEWDKHEYVRNKPLLFGTGKGRMSTFLWLKGWDKVVDEEFQYGGFLVLNRERETRYVLWNPKEVHDTFRLRYEYATDVEGRTGKTLFDDRLDPTLPLDPNDMNVRLLQAHLDWLAEHTE